MKKEINRIAINSRRRLHCQLATFHAKANLIFNSLPRSSSSAQILLSEWSLYRSQLGEWGSSFHCFCMFISTIMKFSSQSIGDRHFYLLSSMRRWKERMKWLITYMAHVVRVGHINISFPSSHHVMCNEIIMKRLLQLFCDCDEDDQVRRRRRLFSNKSFRVIFRSGVFFNFF